MYAKPIEVRCVGCGTWLVRVVDGQLVVNRKARSLVAAEPSEPTDEPFRDPANVTEVVHGGRGGVFTSGAEFDWRSAGVTEFDVMCRCGRRTRIDATFAR